MKRRAALGFLGGFGGLAIGLAPTMHASTDLGADVELVETYYLGDPALNGVTYDEEPDGDFLPVVAVDVDVANNDAEALDPVWFTWDQKRKTRHRWPVQSGPVPLEAGERGHYRLVAPAAAAWMNPGVPVQLTVFAKGEQRWESIQLVAERREAGT